MEYFWFWLLIILILFAIFALPTWPYTRSRRGYGRPGWRYIPSGVAALLAVLLLMMLWLGLIAAWPVNPAAS
jgi:hypothetical protein